MNRTYNIITWLQSLLLVFCLFPSTYQTLVVILFILGLARLIIKIGDGSFFLELLHVYAIFTCLLMPLLGYSLFNRITEMGPIWGRVMPVSEDLYYSFTFPAVIVLGWGFFVFRKKS